MRTSKLVVGLVCGVLAASGAQAQVQQGLEYSLTPFIWGQSLDGTIALGAVSGDVDVSFSDLADALEMTLPIHFEAKGPVWTLIAEINYADLSQDLDLPRSATGQVDVEMLTVELLSGYQLSNVTELIFGARYVDIDAALKFDVPGGPGAQRRFGGDQNWIDPVVGLRYGGPISRRWLFNLRVDAAGFGLGSDLTWNSRIGFGVEVSNVTTILFGWHWMDTDYDETGFTYDMLQSGPEVGFKFKL